MKDIFIKKQQGITLIALVVTIIILLILAAVTISFVLSDNGIIGKGKQSKEEYEVTQILDRLNTVEAASFSETLGSNNLEAFIEQMKKEGIVDMSEDNLERDSDNIHATVTIDGYVFDITDVEGDIQFEYVGIEGNLPPSFKVTKVTTNTIQIEVARAEGATNYTYYYKKTSVSNYDSGTSKKEKIHEFTELEAGQEYNIKVEIKINGTTKTIEKKISTIMPQLENIVEAYNKGKIKIGDYVAYDPSNETNYVVSSKYSGYSSNQTIGRENLGWRVFDTKNGEVRLISANNTEAGVTFSGANGYNNCVYLLDELCSKLYGGTNSTAQSLKIEDIEEKMNLSYWNYTSSSGYGQTYNLNYKQYPNIFLQEKDQIVNGSSGTLGLSQQLSLITGSGTASSWTVKCTYWNSVMSASNYTNAIYYDLIDASTNTSTYLSSRCVSVTYASNLDFRVRYIDSSGTNKFWPFNSNGAVGTLTCRVRPIVSLKSNVQVIIGDNNHNGSTVEKSLNLR